ncbi:toll/interleukin-1 receptor domain-containing protein [Cryptosporangium sp. NPDC048952]|uniref:toll/interleukin-1 receptor domain-containing protein n=1 Tax=Cryptosporangium sp. NPDC048952 TaxID=3363961 RepID=UPI00371A9926
MAHDAFITYAWAEGTGVASALQHAIKTIGTPWYGTGTLAVHRDTTDTEPSGSLRSDLFAELDASRYLILLASPKAARSRWVEREVGHWLSGSGAAALHAGDAPKPIDRLILVLLDGEIHWGRDDFDWSRTDCLPRALSGRYAALPRYIDLRWAVGREDLSVHDPDFRSEAATIAAPIIGTSRRELLGRDVREFGRARRTALSALAALALLLVVSLVVSGVAIVDGRSEARAHDRAAADLRTTAAQAFLRDATRLRTSDPERALQTGMAAQYLAPGREATRALTEALRATPFAGVVRTHAMQAAVLSPESLLASDGGTISSWDLDPVQRRSRVPAPGGVMAAGKDIIAVGAQLWDGALRTVGTVPFTGVSALGFSPDGRTLATGGSAGQVRFWDVSTPSAPRQRGDVIGGGTEQVTALAFGTDLLAYARSGTVRIWRVADGAPTAQLATVDGPTDVTDLAFSPDGARLAVASAAGIQLIDVTQPTAARRVRSTGRYSTLAWSSDGKWVAGGGDNGAVTVWDAGTRLPVISASAQKGLVLDLVFDGPTLLSAGADGTVMRWSVIPAALPYGSAALIGAACRRAGGGLSREVWESYAPGVDYRDTCAS